MVASKSFQRRADPFCFRDHSKDRHFNVAGWFAPGPVFELTRQLHQAHRAKMTAAALDRMRGRGNPGAIVLAHLQSDCAHTFSSGRRERP